MQFPILLLCAAAALPLLSGCDLPPRPAASAERPSLAANPPAIRKHHDCIFETGSRLCRETDEEVDGAALGSSGSPDIQAAKVPAGVGFH